MKYRALTIDNDYQLNLFHKDTSECVGQAVVTRLRLWFSEFFLDLSDGTPYMEDILGVNTNYDLEIQQRILDTPGVSEIVEYSSEISSSRQLTVYCVVNTIYGVTTVTL